MARAAPPASSHRPALTVRRQLELAALLATIPAFYLAALATWRPVAALLYAAAAAASVAVVVDEWPRADPEPLRATLARFHLGALLAIGLVLSALLPPGDGLDVLLVRLGTAVLVILRFGDSVSPWFWRGDLPRLLSVALGVLTLCGLGFWWLEPQARSFGDGVWLAFTTAATVGYGDIVPSTPAAKIFAVFVVLLGFTILSLVTASVAAMWIQSEERKIEKVMLRDLHHEVRLVRDAIRQLQAELAARPAQNPPGTPPDDRRSADPPAG